MTALLPRCMCQQFEMALAVRCAVNAPSLTRAAVMWWGEACSATTECSERFSDAQHGKKRVWKASEVWVMGRW